MKKRIINSCIIFLLGIVIVYNFGINNQRLLKEWQYEISNELLALGERFVFPIYSDKKREENIWEEIYQKSCPLFSYIQKNNSKAVAVEDETTYAMILEAQELDEEVLQEDITEAEPLETVVQTDITSEKMKDPNYLLSTYYTVDSTTMIGADQINIEDLTKYDMHIDKKKEGPKILIFHTHSQEDFRDSVKGDVNTTIVGMGAYLSELLNMKGIKTMHHSEVFDLIDGKLDRSKAYTLSTASVKEILNQYPSIEVVIDLHRDGVREDLHLVKKIDGKPTGKIMYFNGLSRTKTNGDISYLHNPYIDENLSFSFQMQLATERMYPGLARKIYLKGYRYSLHMMPKSLLIEAGAQTNTVAEMKNTMEALANVLAEVLL